MSQYTNQINLNVAEAATFTFNHIMNTGDHETTVAVVMVTMPIECLRDMQRVINETVRQLDEVPKFKSARKGMN